MLRSNSFTPSFWYAHGNIIRFDADYHGKNYGTLRGFFRVERDHQDMLSLVPCDEKGDALPAETIAARRAVWCYDLPSESRVEAQYGQWLWHNVNEGRHPGLDRYNAEQRQAYLAYPDEQRLADDREQQAKRQAAEKAYRERRAAMTDLERRVEDFDWTYHYADRADWVGMGAKETALLKEIGALGPVEGKRIWETYGPKGHHGGRPPVYLSAAA